MLERVYQNQKIRPVVYPFAKQPWVANGQTGRKKGQGEIEKASIYLWGIYHKEQLSERKMANREPKLL